MSIRTVIRLSRRYAGRYRAAGVSRSTLPSSTSCSTTAAVRVLETDANGKAVPMATGSLRPTSRRPLAPAQLRPSSHTIATEMPGMPLFARNSSSAFCSRLAGTSPRVVAGVPDGAGADEAPGASVAAGGGSVASAGASGVAAGVGASVGAWVAPATATPSGLRSGEANTPVTASARATRATTMTPAPAGFRSQLPWRREAPDEPADPRGGRACGWRESRSRSMGSFGMMVRR